MEAKRWSYSSYQYDEPAIIMAKLASTGLLVVTGIVAMMNAAAQENNSVSELKRVLNDRLPAIDISSKDLSYSGCLRSR